MSAEALRSDMRHIKRNLESVNTYLRNVQTILNDSITFDNEGFKSDQIDLLKTKANKQKDNVIYNIMPELYDDDK